MKICWDGTPSKRPNFDANLVDDMRADIIQESTNVMALVDELRKMRMVTGETYSIIEETKTNQDKMREIFRMVLRQGDMVKAAFYDALKKHEPHILNSHGTTI
uniref:CARD domain-containing protein n=1 Tax=Cyprinodon variegatus TaxID=28743 RepID=A0A3Q2E0L4_CYPVA